MEGVEMGAEGGYASAALKQNQAKNSGIVQ